MNALAIVRERLSRLFSEYSVNSGTIKLPDYVEWVATMWHFGADGSVEYKGERFCVTWQIARDHELLIRKLNLFLAQVLVTDVTHLIIYYFYYQVPI